MGANSADAQPLGSNFFIPNGGEGNFLVKQSPNDAGPVVYSDYLFGAADTGLAGTLSVTLGDVTLSSAATLDISGAVSATLGTLTGSGSGTVDLSASLAGQLQELTLVSAGTVDIAATLASTLGAVTLVSEGDLAATAITGELSVTLGGVTLVSGAELSPTDQIGGGGGNSGYFTRVPRRRDEDEEEEREKPPLEIVRIGPADRQIITGIVVEQAAKARKPQSDTLKTIARQQRVTESKKRERIRRTIAADDEWLMMM